MTLSSMDDLGEIKLKLSKRASGRTANQTAVAL